MSSFESASNSSLQSSSQSKNLVYFCVFHKEEYVKLLFLLLESMHLFGNVQEDTDIIIYTTTEFKNRIEKSHLYTSKIQFQINDSYTTLVQACKARLDIFSFPVINNYQKILYLDTDILFRHPIENVFNIITEEMVEPKLYALMEGQIDHHSDMWGKSLFGNDIHQYKDRRAFSSGIMLFPNHIEIMRVFNEIKQHMSRNNNQGFYDQPYLNYHFFRNRMYDNVRLKNVAILNCQDIMTPKTLIHFCGGVGNHGNKYDKMANFMRNIKDDLIQGITRITKDLITQNLMPIINSTGEKLEGNLFTPHLQKNFTDRFVNKQKNLISLAINPKIRRVLEIGFNAGFSSALMLFSNPHLQLTCVDLGEHKYTLPCFQFLEQMFPGRITIHIGDSTKVMPTIRNQEFDMIHIDGGHMVEVAESDIVHSYRLIREGGILIFDDYSFPHLHTLWDKYINIYNLKKLDFPIYHTPDHDIRYVLTK